MKKVLFSLLIFTLAAGLAFGADLTPKDVACEAGCRKTFDDCKGKARGNKLKDMGCKTAHDKCLKDCKAEKKDENKGKKVEPKPENKNKK